MTKILIFLVKKQPVIAAKVPKTAKEIHIIIMFSTES